MNVFGATSKKIGCADVVDINELLLFPDVEVNECLSKFVC